mmetsp:Transcript_27294/g.63062  ORF Transcript_27294/g.63062 Transcript_27294/m.63062 type:complete len:203 (-) Transcript_27294:943-1551(-)
MFVALLFDGSLINPSVCAQILLISFNQIVAISLAMANAEPVQTNGRGLFALLVLGLSFAGFKGSFVPLQTCIGVFVPLVAQFLIVLGKKVLRSWMAVVGGLFQPLYGFFVGIFLLFLSRIVTIRSCGRGANDTIMMISIVRPNFVLRLGVAFQCPFVNRLPLQGGSFLQSPRMGKQVLLALVGFVAIVVVVTVAIVRLPGPL